jgi:hypothetical protein
MAHLAAGFLQKLVNKVFIEHYSVERILLPTLCEESSLGVHTSVFHFTHKLATEHAWFHCQLRPLCFPLAPQCKFCGQLHSLHVKYKDHEVVVSCKDKRCQKVVDRIPREKWTFSSDIKMSHWMHTMLF